MLCNVVFFSSLYLGWSASHCCDKTPDQISVKEERFDSQLQTIVHGQLDSLFLALWQGRNIRVEQYSGGKLPSLPLNRQEAQRAGERLIPQDHTPMMSSCQKDSTFYFYLFLIVTSSQSYQWINLLDEIRVFLQSLP